MIGITLLALAACTALFGISALYGRSVWRKLTAQSGGEEELPGTVQVASISTHTSPPTDTDEGEVGELWVDVETDSIYIRKAIPGGKRTWTLFTTFSGQNGTQWLRGTGVPQDGRPVSVASGDHYLDELTGVVYVADADGKWVASGNVQGDNTATVYNGHKWTKSAAANPPTDPSAGDMWLNTDTSILSIWVPAVEVGGEGEWSAVKDHTGADGVAGENTPVWVFGSGAPGAGTTPSTDGTWYVDQSNMNLYRRISGAWSLLDEGQLPAIWSASAGAPSPATPTRAGLFHNNTATGEFFISTDSAWELITQVRDVDGGAGDQVFLVPQHNVGTVQEGQWVTTQSTLKATPDATTGTGLSVLDTDSGALAVGGESSALRDSGADAAYEKKGFHIVPWHGGSLDWTGSGGARSLEFPNPSIEVYDETGTRHFWKEQTAAYGSITWRDALQTGETTSGEEEHILLITYPSEDGVNVFRQTFFPSLHYNYPGVEAVMPEDPWSATGSFYAGQVSAALDTDGVPQYTGTQLSAKLEPRNGGGNPTRVLELSGDGLDSFEWYSLVIDVADPLIGFTSGTQDVLNNIKDPDVWEWSGSTLIMDLQSTYVLDTTPLPDTSALGILMRINVAAGTGTDWQWHLAVPEWENYATDNTVVRKLRMLTWAGATPNYDVDALGYMPFWPPYPQAIAATGTIVGAGYLRPGNVLSSGFTNGSQSGTLYTILSQNAVDGEDFGFDRLPPNGTLYTSGGNAVTLSSAAATSPGFSITSLVTNGNIGGVLISHTYWVDLRSTAHPTLRTFRFAPNSAKLDLPAPSSMTLYSTEGAIIYDTAASTVIVRPPTRILEAGFLSVVPPYVDDEGTASSWTYILEVDPLTYTATGTAGAIQQRMRPEWFLHGLDLHVTAGLTEYLTGTVWQLRVRAPTRWAALTGAPSKPSAYVFDADSETGEELVWYDVEDGRYNIRERVGYDTYEIGATGYALNRDILRSGQGWIYYADSTDVMRAPGNSVHIRAIPVPYMGDTDLSVLATAQTSWVFLEATPTYTAAYLANTGVENGHPLPSLWRDYQEYEREETPAPAVEEWPEGVGTFPLQLPDYAT